jgi:hypothetical protein
MKDNGTKSVPYKSKSKKLDKISIPRKINKDPSLKSNDPILEINDPTLKNKTFGLSNIRFEYEHEEPANNILIVFIKLCDLMKKFGYERSNVKYYDDGIFISIEPIDMYNWFHEMNIDQKKDLMNIGLGKEILNLFSFELDISDFQKDVKIFNHRMDMLVFNKGSLLKIDFIIKYLKIQQEIVTIKYFK